MKKLVSITTNILYGKKKNQNEYEFVKHYELIFLLDTPKYRYSNEGEIIRERGLDEMRFTISENDLENLIKLLKEIKDIDE
jgi:hypothetical protein